MSQGEGTPDIPAYYVHQHGVKLKCLLLSSRNLTATRQSRANWAMTTTFYLRPTRHQICPGVGSSRARELTVETRRSRGSDTTCRANDVYVGLSFLPSTRWPCLVRASRTTFHHASELSLALIRHRNSVVRWRPCATEASSNDPASPG